jgi:iron(III) transport system permease protein
MRRQGIVLAIACILLFIKPLPVIGVSIYATPWIILFAYHARFLRDCAQAGAGGDGDTLDAVRGGGHLRWRAAWPAASPHHLPLVLPAVLAGMR